MRIVYTRSLLKTISLNLRERVRENFVDKRKASFELMV
jgi:hypothetical protein